MSESPPSGHFQGKSVVEHLREARARGALASSEIHGAEIPGHLAAGADASKETAIALVILWIVLSRFFPLGNIWMCLSLFSAGWMVWKVARSALLGWARVERLHRLIEEERWEIEHHRAQEREELTEMYVAKGLQGKLLEEVIDVLMADDNRLLHIMLEEELGLTLEVYEHPLKQAFGALCGTVVSASLCLFGLWAFPSFGLLVCAAVAIAVSAALASRVERNRRWNAVVWNLAIGGMVAGCIYFLIPLITGNR